MIDVDSYSDAEFNERRWKQYNVVKNLYTWEKTAKKVEKLYKDVLSERTKNKLPIGSRLDQYFKPDNCSKIKSIPQISGVLYLLSVVLNILIFGFLDLFDQKSSLKKIFNR